MFSFTEKFEDIRIDILDKEYDSMVKDILGLFVYVLLIFLCLSVLAFLILFAIKLLNQNQYEEIVDMFTLHICYYI